MARARLIGEYTDGRKGPMIICLAAVHGNEPAGIKASELMLKMLEVEPITNSKFEFNGTFISILGNLEAYIVNERFIEKDMNRAWHKDHIDQIMAAEKSSLQHEDFEIREVMDLIHKKIKQYKPERVILLDMHTTSSDGGIFAIPNEKEASLLYAMQMNAPVIMNMLKGISGTTLDYFTKENFDVDIVSVVFESGQHFDPVSVNRAIAALTNLMAAAGSFDESHIANRHNAILDEYSKGLPRISTLVDKFYIEDITKFEMLPGFKNFQSIKKGDHIANYDGEKIHASHDGMILMPLYQKQGEDGFFIVQKVETPITAVPA